MDHDLPLHPKGKDPFFYVFPQGGCSLFRAAAPLSNDVGSWRILAGPPARGEPSVLLMHHGTTEVDHGTGRDFGGTCGGALEHFFFWRVFPTTPVVCSQIPIPGIQWPDSDTGAGTLEHKSTSCQLFDFISPTVFPQCGFNTFSVHQKNSLWPNCGTWQLAWVGLNDSWVKGVCEANIVLIV